MHKTKTYQKEKKHFLKTKNKKSQVTKSAPIKSYHRRKNREKTTTLIKQRNYQFVVLTKLFFKKKDN